MQRRAEGGRWLEAEVVELVAAFGDDLVLVDPDVAVAGEDVDVGAGFPVGVGLAAVGVAEGDVHAGEFFVLKEDADHFREAEVGAESELAYAITVFVGVAVVPELLFEGFALTLDMLEAGAVDFEDQGRALQVSVLAVEVIAGGGIADESAVDACRGGENFAGGKIGPVTRADEAAGLDPVEAAIEMCGEFGARFSFYGESFGAQHAFAELVAEAIDHAVVGAHALLHNFRRNTDHVRVADLAALDDSDDGHARAEFAGLRVHAENASVGGFEGVEHGGGRCLYGARAEIFEQETGACRMHIFHGGSEAGGDGAAGHISD